MEYILSIDASLSSTGWAVMERLTRNVVKLGKICTTTAMEQDDRIFKVTMDLIYIAMHYNIHTVAMEDGYASVRINAKTSLQLAELRGGITIGLKMNNIKTFKHQPCDTKCVFTGKGNSSKEEVAKCVLEIYKDNQLVIDLGPFSDKANKKKNSDIYDAISIGYSLLERFETEGV